VADGSGIVVLPAKGMLMARRSVSGERTGDDPVPVLTVEDQASFRAVLKEVVDAADGFQLVGEVASGEAALEAVAALSPSLVIVDKRMPGMGGIEACRLLTQRHPELVVVIMSVEDSDHRVTESCRAAAFVRKQELSPRRLADLWREHRAAA
jgi:DNA-binding NarL/FixJ family response regulator